MAQFLKNIVSKICVYDFWIKKKMFCRHFFKNGPNPAAFLHTVTNKEQNLTINGRSAGIRTRDFRMVGQTKPLSYLNPRISQKLAKILGDHFRSTCGDFIDLGLPKTA